MGSLDQTAVFSDEHEFYSWAAEAEGISSICWLGRSGLVVFSNGWHQTVFVR